MDYKNGKIYAIRSYQTDMIYIGSTCSPLNKRFYEHKRKYKSYLNGNYRYVTSFEIVKYNDCYIELIELYPCNSKIELHKREGELIREMNCVNKFIPGRTQKQYKIDNQDKIKQYLKQYRIDNRDKRKQYEKQYKIDNRDKIKQYMKLKYNCICGSITSRNDKSKHYKTKKHRTYIFNLHNELNHL